MTATNVALRKSANQSSTARGGSALNAIDGDRSTFHDVGGTGGRCAETSKEASPWWICCEGGSRSRTRTLGVAASPPHSGQPGAASPSRYEMSAHPVTGSTGLLIRKKKWLNRLVWPQSSAKIFVPILGEICTLSTELIRASTNLILA